MNCSAPGFPVLHYVPEYAQTHLHWGVDAIQPSHPLLPPSLPALNFLSIRVFSNESVLRIRWPVYWSFTCSISPSNEYSGMISFRVDQFDLLAVQGTLKSLLQYHKFESTISLAPSLLYGPVFTTVKTIALTIWIFVSKVMSMLFDTLSRFVTAFLLRSEHLLISCCCHHLQWFRIPTK